MTLSNLSDQTIYIGSNVHVMYSEVEAFSWVGLDRGSAWESDFPEGPSQESATCIDFAAPSMGCFKLFSLF